MSLKFNFNSSVCSVADNAPTWWKISQTKCFGKFHIYDLNPSKYKNV